MKQKLYLIIGCILLLQNSHAIAQCTGGRYENEIFSSYTVDSVTYSDTFGLKVDVYQPAGDTLSARPLVIFAHEGTFVSGTRETDITVDSLCVRFAKRGYVTASIDYRLGNLVNMVLDSSVAINEVMEAVSDGKAAIRYFVKDRATTNQFKIDTNSIFIGGNSAGAVLYMHVGYMKDTVGVPADIMTAMDANGGFEGNSGNAGYTTRFRGIVDLAGGLNRVSFVTPWALPSVNCQGSLDDVVPFYCADAVGGEIQVDLCGLGSLLPQYTAMSVYNMSIVFEGQGHVPWDADSANNSYFTSVDSIVTAFLYANVCGGVTAVNNVQLNTEVSLYPNPANNVVNVSSSQQVSEITVYDETGRIVFLAGGISTSNYEINTSRFSAGVYFVKMRFSNQDNTPVIKRLVIE